MRADDLAHGGRLIEARRLFPKAPEPFIDLSTGINPLSYPIPAIETSAWTRLPGSEAIARVEAVAAKVYGVADGSMVASVPRTQLLISLLPRLFPHASVAILGPTYGEYARSFDAGPAVEIGSLALADRAWREAAKQRLAQAVTRLDGMLREAGMTVIGGMLLFRLAESTKAQDVFQRLGAAGVFVRGFDYRPDWLRCGIPGGEDEWRRLSAALSII